MPTRRECVVGTGFVALCVLAAAARGQWSTDPTMNLAVADRPGEQVQPKVRATNEGGVYVSWFDNAAGGYDVYLQRLNREGVEQWPHNGVLVADRSFSSTQDYGLAVDTLDRAVITYRDDRTGSVQIGVNLVAPDGTLLWGAGGVIASNTTEFVASPKVCAGRLAGVPFYVVAWTQGSSVLVQRFTETGAPVWPSPAVITPSSGSYSVTDVVISQLDSVIVGLVKGTQRHLHAQKISPTGGAEWPAPVVVFDGSALQFGYFPTFVGDGSGGAAFAWYETGGTRNVYVQRLTSAGVEMFPHNGVAVSTNTTDRIRLSPSVAFSRAADRVVCAWTESNVAQSMWGLSGQSIDAQGVRRWSETGLELLPLSTNQNAFVKTVEAGTGSMVFCFDRSGPSQVLGWRLDVNGASLWPGAPVVLSSVMSTKFRLDATTGNCVPKVVWGDARTDAGNVYIQNVGAGGSLGATCYADGNSSCSLTIADFSMFQDSFVAGFPYADCNGSGVLTIADFACFQSKFVGGCP